MEAHRQGCQEVTNVVVLGPLAFLVNKAHSLYITPGLTSVRMQPRLKWVLCAKTGTGGKSSPT